MNDLLRELAPVSDEAWKQIVGKDLFSTLIPAVDSEGDALGEEG